MSKEAKTLEELLRDLPANRRDEVRDFVKFLLARGQGKPRGKPQFTWAGALKDLLTRYTSVDLQHQIARWRIEAE